MMLKLHVYYRVYMLSARCMHNVCTLLRWCTVISSLFQHCVYPSCVCLSQTKCTNFFPTNCTLQWISSIRILFTFFVVCCNVPFNLKRPCTTMLTIITFLLPCCIITQFIHMLVKCSFYGKLLIAFFTLELFSPCCCLCSS